MCVAMPILGNIAGGVLRMRISLGRVPAYGLAYCALLVSTCVCLTGAQQVEKTEKVDKKKTEVVAPPGSLPDLDVKKDDMTKAAGAAVESRSRPTSSPDRVWCR